MLKLLSSRLVPHILFVTERWWAYKPEGGATNNEHNLFGSLASTGLATYSTVHYDECEFLGRNINDVLQNCCDYIQPDLLFLSLNGVEGTSRAPSPDILRGIRTISNIPIVMWWSDTASGHPASLYDSLYSFADLHIIADTFATYITSPFKDKYITLWVPQDPRIYNDPGLERSIDVSFAGDTVAYRPHRKEMLMFLESQGVKVYVAGGRYTQKLSVEEYSSIYKRSKISLDFSAEPGNIQIRGRIWEILSCGALLIEDYNPEIHRFLTPGEDYVEHKNGEELVNIIKYYLEHSDERYSIALKGYSTFKEKYNSKIFWETVFSRVGLY